MSRLHWVLLGALVVAAALLRLEHQSQVALLDVLARRPAGDELTFTTWAHRVATGHDDAVPYQAPLYPTLLGALEKARGEREVPSDARLLQALLGLAAAGLAALLAFELTRDGRVAVVAFFLAAFARPLIHAEGTLLREAPSAALLAACALAYARARSTGSPRDHATLGVALGLGVLLRENFAVVALVVFTERLLALRSPSPRAAGGGSGWGEAFLPLALALLCFLIPVLPFDVKVARLGDGVHLLPNWNQGCVFYIANRRDNATAGDYQPPPFVARGNPEAEVEGFEAEARRRGHDLHGHALSSYWLREGLREVAAAPRLFAFRVAARLLSSLSPVEMAHQRDPDVDAESSWVLRAPLLDVGVLVALALVGLVFLSPRGKGEVALLIIAASWWASLLVAAFTTRYRVPAIPVLAVLGALGARDLARALARPDPWRRPRVLASLIIIVLIFFGLRLGVAPRDHATALRTRANSYVQVEDYENAAKDLRRVLAVRPKEADAWLLLGMSLLRQRGPDVWGARDAYLEAARLGQQDAWHPLGFCELIARRPHAALEALAHCDPHDPQVQSDIAKAREKASQGPDQPVPLPRR
ncbi:MAG TPA: tetratricopeptide repeat protein [Planctomycetota bacterium]|nr:tetratricopeptide repeat protein [Planctomycetota bacterium]